MVAVSGGIDSVSLLHMLQNLSDADLVVAHFDHGIRPDSVADREFVESLAAQYGISFIYEEGRLGPRASEAVARAARYGFLNRVKSEYGAHAIITAHHQDDVLETAIINVLRGTGRKGLGALADKPELRRPLLDISKQDILKYAGENDLSWREDSTNTDERYLRNYVRHRIMPRLDTQTREMLLDLITKSQAGNHEIDTLLVKYLPANGGGKLRREVLVALPHDIARELMAAWLRENDLRDFDSKTLERLVIGAKTARSGSRFDVAHTVSMRVGKSDLALVGAER